MTAIPARVIGRYALYGEIAAGGMATVHYGRLQGPVGFSRTVAIKRLHPQFAKDPEFVSMFLDEARIAARIRHPNVVATLDVVATEGELFLVMDYVQGESLSRLAKAARMKKERMPPRILASVMCGALHGLHAAHEAKNERGEPLHIVHRDISPQNVLVGTDGTSRVLDFGVAKAAGRIQNTKEGHLKGKIAYMSPEQIRGNVSRRTDVYAAAIVTWELLTGKRLFAGEDEVSTIAKVLEAKIDPPSQVTAGVPKELDEVVLKGLAFEESKRYQTAREMALALEKAVGVASPSEVGDWVESHATNILKMRADCISEIESSSSANLPPIDGSNLVAELGAKSAPKDESARDAPPASAPTPATPMPPDSMKTTPPPARKAAEPAAKPSDYPKSSVSSISVASPAETATPPRRSATIWVVGAAFLAVAAVAFALGGRSSSSPATPPATPATAAVPAATTAASAPTTAVPPPAAEPSAEEPAPAEASKTGPAAKGSRGPRPAAAPPKAAAPKAANCSPPYTLDSSGRKKYKPECL